MDLSPLLANTCWAPPTKSTIPSLSKNAYSHTHARASHGQTISPQSHPHNARSRLRGHPTNVPRLPTTRPRRPTIHKTHTNSPTHPTSNTSTPINPARITQEPHRQKRSSHNISTQPIFQAQAPSITGITHNFLGAEHISANQQPRTQRPRRTTPRLCRHSISPYIIQLCTQTSYKLFHTRRPPRKVPTTKPPRSPCRHIFSHTNPKVDRTSTSLRNTSNQKG